MLLRTERWWWLALCCVVSLGLHVEAALRNPRWFSNRAVLKPTEIEVALEPLPEPKPKPEPKPEPPPKPEPEKKTADLAKLLRPERGKNREKQAPVRNARTEVKRVALAPPRIIKTDEPKPTAPAAEPGGLDKLKDETPLTFGLPSGRKSAAPMLRMAKADPITGGGGSPAPGPVPGGHDGAPAPQVQDDPLIYYHGGAGGMKLPVAPPAIGGGGGKSILSVDNPLAKEFVHDETPGEGPGLTGGAGAGAGGGLGYGRGKGIGTKPNGIQALATLQRKPGPGIGAATGRGVGTKPQASGRGTGAELPGTGGTGVGYGTGSGIGFGAGRSVGFGNGSGGTMLGLDRGIPFGDLSGLLKDGDPNGGGGTGGGPGGPGAGGVFGTRPVGRGALKNVHIVYLIDVSGSMQQSDKIGKAKDALKKALAELKPTDSFNIIAFYGRAQPLDPDLLDATEENVRIGMRYVDLLRIGPGTNVANAFQTVFSMKGITHVFFLSDGEPNMGIQDFDELRGFVRRLNREKAYIITLALGLGEQFPGIPLLKGIAEDNEGRFSYVNLAR